MQCSRCQTENRAGRRFCAACGTALAIVCAACGFANEADEQFCGGCGIPLLPAVPASTSKFSSPQSYTPKYLAEKILTSRVTLAGERKQVTVLFCDLANSTALAQRLGPETMHQLLNRFFELALDEVHRYEGTINQFLGDGFMALFGAPIAHEDHARRAVLAAVGLRRRLHEGPDTIGKHYGVDIVVRLGLHTGLVVVGAIGDNLRMDYTAIGDTTNVAARLQQAATPGHIVISEATHRLVTGYCTTHPLGELSLKGKDKPIPAWEVLAAQETRTRLEVAAEQGLTPFVGREGELQSLTECFAQAQAGHGQVVFLVGEAGIGKSRLLLEWRRRLGDKDATWLEGHAMSFGKAMPFHPLIDLLRRNFHIQEHDAESAIMEKIDQGILRLSQALRPILPYVRCLLGVDPGDAAVRSMDPQLRRAETFDALRRLLLQAAEARPQVLLFEDLHWMDKATEDLLTVTTDSIPTSRVMCLFTYRPGYVHPFGDRTYHRRLVLPTLSNADTVHVAQAMLATQHLPEALQALIVQKAEGNPFFVEEVVKSLRETGAIVRQDDRYVLARPLAEVLVPDTIQDVLMARIDRLEEAPKKTLQLASVIGREFTRRLLNRLADMHDPTGAYLQELKALELIYETQLFPELAYMFKHALTHDVAYNSLLRHRRQALHRLVAMAIEELYAERLPEFYEMLAYHYEQAEVWDKALAYLLQAGQKAQQAYANHEALRHFERALTVCERLGVAVEPTTLLTLHAGKGAGHFCRSEFRPAVVHYQHVVAIARQLRDQAAEVQALHQIGFAFFWAHDFEQALTYSEQARDLALAIDAKGSLAASLWIIGKVHLVTGRLDEAMPYLADALRISREAADKGIEGLVLYDLGILFSWRGEYEQAQHFMQQSTSLGQTHNLQLLLLISLWIGALVSAGKGAYAEALTSLQQGLELSERLGDKLFKCRILNTLGWIYGEIYDLERARHYNQEGLTVSSTLGDPEIIRNAALNLGDNYLALGDLVQAQQHFETVHQDAQQRGTWGEEWMKWRYTQHLAHSLGELWLRKGSPQQAGEYAETCLRLSEPSMSRKNLVKGRRLQGQALLALGQSAQAQEALSRALTMAQDIGNPTQLWKTYQALGELYEAQADLERARVAYRNAMDIIEDVAERLHDPALQRTFFAAQPIQHLRECLARTP